MTGHPVIPARGDNGLSDWTDNPLSPRAAMNGKVGVLTPGRGIRKLGNPYPEVGILPRRGMVSEFFSYLSQGSWGVTRTRRPTTGLPFPFLSYGGSAIVANLFCVGVLLNISRFNAVGSVERHYTLRRPRRARA